MFNIFKKSCMPDITITWDVCKCVTITSSKDLSNVVLDLEEGYIKYDDLSGYTKTFCSDDLIKGVWVKSGCNHNEDEEHPCPEGSGCGEYFDNPNYPNCVPTPPDATDLVVLTWGSNKCREEDGHFDMSGNVVNDQGYPIPYNALLDAITVSWSDECGDYDEKIIVQKNGVDMDAHVVIDNTTTINKKCIVFDEPIRFYNCDAINIVSRKNDKCWMQACNVEVTAWIKIIK